MDDRFKGILTFVRVADAGSFAAAAMQTGVTRSAIGKSISKLEDRLKVRLFHRSTRSQSLTESGRQFYEHCKTLLAELEAAELALDSTRSTPTGNLRVSVPTLFGRHVIAPVLAELVNQNPEIALELSFSDKVIDLVKEGFDLAIRVGTLPDSSTIASRLLGYQSFELCASPSYITKHGMPTSITDFANHIGIVYSSNGWESPWLACDNDGNLRELPIKRKFRFDDVQTIADATQSGLGISRLPGWLISEAIVSGKLVQINSVHHILKTEISIVWPQTRYMSSKMRIAIDTLVEKVAPILLTK